MAPRTRRSLAIAAVAALAWAAPAQAEVRLAGEAGGNFRIPVKSWWEIPFRSVVRQQYDFSCGSAAVATLLTYHYGQRVPEQFAFSRMWQAGDQAAIRKTGFSMLDMKSLLTSLGYRSEGFRLGYDDLAASGKPGIVLINLRGYKHFVVVKGMRNGTVLVGDPMLGISQYSRGEFEKMWNGVVLAIVEAPKAVRPKYNLASDWGPWAAAPLEDNIVQASTGSLTSHLPPLYQVSNETLFDVRTATIVP